MNKIINIFSVIILIILIAITSILLYNEDDIIYKVENRLDYIESSKEEDKETGYNTIGWLRVQGTNIDLKVYGMEVDDDGIAGNINFAWNNTSDEVFHNVVNLMGHNILNLSSNPLINKDYFVRFDDLMSYSYIEFAKNNKYIEYSIDGVNHIYKIFAVYIGHTDLTTDASGNYSKKERKSIINRALKNSIYDYDIDVNGSDNLITLETCTRMFGAFDKAQLYVVAREVRKGEKMYNYDVEANKNYDEILEIMKGDRKNEEA